MRAATYFLAVAVAAGVPATAMAQSTTTPAPAPATSSTHTTTGQWFASGFVGSNFSASLDTDLLDNTNLNNNNNNSSSSLEFGGNVGYTWNRVFGAEFLADFTPSFGVNRILDVADVNRLIDDPHVNTYMFNAIAAIPISAGRFQPFISGGIGGVSVSADVLDNVLDRNGLTTRSSLTRMGTNLGGGYATFPGVVGTAMRG
jgi:hypothetical protein